MITYNRKTVERIEEKTPNQYRNMTIGEVFLVDMRNTIDKLKNRNIGRLIGLQIGLIQESIKHIGVDTSIKFINPIKEYEQKIKVSKKYDNNIKY